ncbi:hypothetical protein N7448_008859 [Penicillium atrosanguineum]|uniref:NmrA-like domain-containing protein n=1 Tax=Penicillium atrosanguineum TaxID=1132637 RepID=A0A9W9GS16_9EURO|nr:uncharacterized protein N7443_000113 [Penicillium atrosanguineum]KAJ5128080.1 hypothetical protein N7448_008859 [Penicillium atrosanguineum]KAJ5148290.1 hypothetical protein N7526_001642 [Penicillium atrosanguineum]KAJ5313229.1 hypothetical protein N7443_000113 [Penicillium atrosanguineum]KAJ5330332.1 hypothetical protein N7476_000115 [Penicillium atrosanguineum]
MSGSITAPAIIVVGASGNLGPFMVQALLEQKARFSRIAILSAPEKKDKFDTAAKDGIDIILGSYKDAKSYEEFDVAISLAGNSIMADQPQMIDAAIRAGVTHFYPSEFGVDIMQPAFLQERYFRDKHLTREHLRKRAGEVSGFIFTEMIIGAFLETFILSDVFGLDRPGRKLTYYGNLDDVKSFSSMADTAKYTVDSIFLPFESGTTERTIKVPNGNYTIREIVEVLNDIDGTQYETRVFPVSDARKEQELARLAKSNDLELAFSLKALFSSPYAVVPKPWQNDMFPFKPKGLVEMIQDCI